MSKARNGEESTEPTPDKSRARPQRLDDFVSRKVEEAKRAGVCPINEKMVEMFKRRALRASPEHYESLWKSFWGSG